MKFIRFLFLALMFGFFTYFFGSGYQKFPAPGKFFNPTSGFWQNTTLDTALPSGYLTLPDLIGKVSVSYDEFLIPHIFAEHESDLWIVQGYIHASHRLWQMEFQTRAISGRLSEVLGPNFLERDRLMRRKGLVHAAETSLESELAQPEAQLALLQYTKGVNAYMANLPKHHWPLEYKLLGYEPELWTPLKSMLLLTYMSDLLSTQEYDLENTLFVNTFGLEAYKALFPDVCNWDDPVINRVGAWPAATDTRDSITDLIPSWTGMLPALKTSSDELVKGSNNWVVGPEKTADSSIILCNDPHLRLQLPSLWMLNQIYTGKIAAKGVSLPGLPGVVLGFNDSVSWGVTNAQRDVVDWYQIKFRNANRLSYEQDGHFAQASKVVEKISIKGQKPFFDTVVYTHFGPVVYDRFYMPDHPLKDYAYKWISHGPTSELYGFIRINQSKSVDEVREAVYGFQSTAQNIVMADTKGKYGLVISGNYPLRAAGEGRFLRYGSHSVNDWSDWIPESHRIEIFNPKSGFVSSANQHPVDSTYPYYIYGVPYEPYRNQRINDVLRSNDSISVEDMMRLQQDNLNLKGKWFSEWIMPRYDSLRFSESAAALLKVLEDWDHFNHAESAGATAFQLLWDALYSNCWAAIKYYGDQLRVPTSYTTLRIMRDEPESPFFDNPRTELRETLDHHLVTALEKAATDFQNLEDASWCKFKNTGAQHILRISALSEEAIPVGGFSGIVNANTGTHGASWRLVTRLTSNGVQAFGIFPGGQSGHVGSPYYSHLVNHWAAGKYLELPFYQAPFGDHTLVFETPLP
jgi:penicillin G amidase